LSSFRGASFRGASPDIACNGVDYLSKPGLVQEGSTKRSNIRLFAVATYAAKDRVFAQMKIPRPGPGYMHLPVPSPREGDSLSRAVPAREIPGTTDRREKDHRAR
jgi:phage terminase large subunit GpA-like protein